MPDALQPITSANAPRYRYYTVDIVSNKIVGEIPFEDVSYERALKQPGSFDGKITVSEQTNALDLYNATLPGKTALYVVRDNEAVWGGIIWGRTYDLVGRSLALSASEFTSYLSHRIVWKTYTQSYSINLNKTATGGTPYFLATINDRTLRTPYELTDGFGNPTKVEITFVDNKLRKYSGFYDIKGSSSSPAAFSNPGYKSFYVDIPKLPAPKSGVYPNVGLSAKSDTYSYLRDIINSVFTDFIDIDFPNEVIEPGIKEAFEVKYMQLTTSNSTNGVAKITTDTAHGLVAGQRIEIANVYPTLDGVHTVSSVPTTTTFEYVLKNPVNQQDNYTPMYLIDIPANTVPFTERTPVYSRQVIQQLGQYVVSLKRLNGYTTIKFNSIHPFVVSQKVVLTLANAKPAIRSIDGKSINIFDYKKVNYTVQIDALTDYTISFTDPLYVDAKYNLKETNVLKTAENFVKNAADKPLLQLGTKVISSYERGNYGRGYNIGSKVRVTGVDGYDWDYPIYNGYHQVYDVSPGLPKAIKTYAVVADTSGEGDDYTYVELTFEGNVGFTEGDFVYVDGLTDDPQLEGEYQLFYAEFSGNTTTIRYNKSANTLTSTNAPAGAAATLNGTSWIVYEPSNSEIRYSLKSEPDSTYSIASLTFVPAKGTVKNKVTLTTQSRHSLSVGDTIMVDFGNAEKGKDTKTYGGRVVVTSVGDLDQISYTLSGKREIPIPTAALPETPKTGVITRKIKSVGITPVAEVKLSSLSAEVDDTGNVAVTAYSVDHDLNAGDYVVIDVDDPQMAAFENKSVPTRIDSVTPNSFTYASDTATALSSKIQSNVVAITCRTASSGKDIMEITAEGSTTPVDYPAQSTKITNVNLTMADKGTVVYTYAPITTATYASGGAPGETTFNISTSNSAIKPGAKVTGTGLASNTVVSAVSGTTITIDIPTTGQVSGTLTFDPYLNTGYDITISGFTDPVPEITPAATGSGAIAAIITNPQNMEATIYFSEPHNLVVTGSIDKNTGEVTVGDITGSLTIGGMSDYVYQQVHTRATLAPKNYPKGYKIGMMLTDFEWEEAMTYTVDITVPLSKLNGTWMIANVPNSNTVRIIWDKADYFSSSGSGASASWVGLPQYKWPVGEASWSFLNMRGDIKSVNGAERKIYVYYPLMPGNAQDLIDLGGAVNDFSSKNIVATFPAYTKMVPVLPKIAIGDYLELTGFVDPVYTKLNNSGPHIVLGVTDVSSLSVARLEIRIATPLPKVKNVRQTLVWPPVGGTTDTPKILMPLVTAGTAYLDYSANNNEVLRVVGASRTSAAPSTTIITTSDEHGFETGDYANVWVYGKGLAAFSQRNEPVQITYIGPKQFSYPMATPTKIQYYSVANKVATVSFNGFSAHNFFVGDTVAISGVHSTINGTRVITSTGAASISFAAPTAANTPRSMPVKGTISLSTALTKTVTITNTDVASMGQVLQSPTIYREPVVFARTWGEFPGSAGIGGMSFSTSEYSGQQSTNSPIYGSALATAAEILDKYSNTLTGFEYRIDVSLEQGQNGEKEFKRRFVLVPLYPTTLTDYLNSLPGKKLAKGQAADPVAFGADKVVFEYPGNITNVSVSESAQNSATRMFVNNKNNKAGEGVESAYAAASATDLLSAGWPLLDRTEGVEWPQGASANTTNTDKWGNHDDEHDYHVSAKRFLRESKPPSGDIVITVNGSLNPVVGSYNPGEWCSIIVHDNFLKNRLGTALEPRKDMFVRRIDAIKVNVPNNPAFPEQINLTLVPDWQVDKVGE